MKNVDLSNSIAADMDKVLNSDENKQLFSSASVLEKLAFKKVSEDDKTTEVEIELENTLTKKASCCECGDKTDHSCKCDCHEEKKSEASEDDVVAMLLQASEDLDTLGFAKLASYSALIADKLMVEAKAKTKSKSDKKSDKKTEKAKSDKKMDMKARMKKMREMQGKGKKDSKKEDKKDSKKSSK